MNRRLALALVIASAACRKDSTSATPADTAAVTPTTATTPPTPATDPAPTDPAPAEATDAGPPVAEVDEVAPVASGPAKPITDPADGLTEPKDFAVVKLEVKQPNKKIYKDATGQIVDWSVPTQIEVDFDGHKHLFVFTAKRSGKSAVMVELDYELDGAEVLRSADLETKLKERGVLLVEGGTAIAVTVANKRVKPKAAPPKDTIEQPAGKDPLSGAEKHKG